MAHDEEEFRKVASALIAAFEHISGKARQLLMARHAQRDAAAKLLMSEPSRIYHYVFINEVCTARGMKEFESVATMMVNVLRLTYGVPDDEAHKYVKSAVQLSLPATKEYVSGNLSVNAIASAMGIRAGKDFVPGEVKNADAEAFCLLVMAS
jgi:hypothetical protein